MWHDRRADLLALLPARGMNLELIWWTAALVGAVLIGIVIIVWVDRWRKRTLTEARGPADELGHYRALLDQGLLSSEEYERIRRRLEQRAEAKPPAAQPDPAQPIQPAPQEPLAPPPLQNGPPAKPGPP